MFDLVIRGGTLYDGTGGPAREADVGVQGDRIVEVGSKLGAGRRELDARGQLVTPGFVDMHTHFDAQASWDPYLTPSSWHGCTTVVMGNCGVGFAPVRPSQHAQLIEMMEAVEDIPGAAMHEGITWGWETFPQYLDALAKAPRVMDYATQVPHCALRVYVMGDRAGEAVATAAEITEMARLVEEGLRAGALGFSTSRTSIHKTKDGDVVPGTHADRAELMAIGRAIARAGHGVFQHATEHADVPRSFEWMRAMVQETGVRTVFSLSQIDWAPRLWQDNLALLDAAHADGLDIWGQSAGRGVGILMNFELTAHPFAAHPSFRALSGLAPDLLRKALLTPEVRARILADKAAPLTPFEQFITHSYSKMFVQSALPGAEPSAAIDYEPTAETSVAAIAQRTGRPPAEVAYDALAQDGGRGYLYFPLFNYGPGDLSAVHALQSHPRVHMGLSDAGAHCGAICDGGMPTFMLTFWTRDRRRGPKLDLATVIRRQTQDTARCYGLDDRGVVAPGYRADLNVIDYARLGFDRPSVAYDLPAGGRRLVQRGIGYNYTIAAGQVTVDHDAFTGALPGRLIRGPQAAPRA